MLDQSSVCSDLEGGICLIDSSLREFSGVCFIRNTNQTVVVSQDDSGRGSRLPSRETSDRFGINTRLCDELVLNASNSN